MVALLLLLIDTTWTKSKGLTNGFLGRFLPAFHNFIIVEHHLDHHCEAFWKWILFGYSRTQLLDKWLENQVKYLWPGYTMMHWLLTWLEIRYADLRLDLNWKKLTWTQLCGRLALLTDPILCSVGTPNCSHVLGMCSFSKKTLFTYIHTLYMLINSGDKKSPWIFFPGNKVENTKMLIYKCMYAEVLKICIHH